MNSSKIKTEKREKRHRRIRSRLSGTQEIPRLSVFKSNTAVYAQLINDDKSETIAAVSSNQVSGKTVAERAKETGKEIGKKALGLSIKKVVFDRGGFRYIGKIKAIADGAREAGLMF